MFCVLVTTVLKVKMLLFLWQMEKLSHHGSGIPVEVDGVIGLLLFGIGCRAI